MSKKNREFVYDRQDRVIEGFRRIIDIEERIASCKQNSEVKVAVIAVKVPVAEKVYMSFYNPLNPMNGSIGWSKQQWADFRKSQRNRKRKLK